ncbi:MAG TPA: DUF2141 domain-containing protein [bacterium]|nr:DUF2141 domain-containing protein [bacterium]
MKRAVPAFVILLLAVGVTPAQLTASRGEITVFAEGFRSEAGEARVALFDASDGFPEEAAKAREVARVEIRDYEARADFTDLPYGTYAVAVLHDENANGVLDRNFFKVPTEGYGASNDPGGTTERVSYDDAKFALFQKFLVIRIHMRY